MIEFALAASAFLLLILGVMQMALAYHYKLVLDHASREGARYAATKIMSSNPTDPTAIAGVQTFVIGRAGTLNPPLQASNINVNVVTATGQDPNVSLSITYNIRAAVPLIAPLLPSQITVTNSSSMRMEQ